jgi:CPA2 family monovalent cation:H+ antiporter-2
LFDVSLALGAFFAGMILSESPLSQRAAQESLPLRDAFAVLFFVSVGMLFDPTTVLREPWPLIATLFIVIIGKSVAAFFIVMAFRYPPATALTISASLAQIGEFSFILGQLGVTLNILPKDSRDLILGGAIISIMLNPFLFTAIDRLTPRFERGRRAAALEDKREIKHPKATPLMNHTILVGFGRVGSIIADALQQRGQKVVVVEAGDNAAAKLYEKNFESIIGNAARPEILEVANPAAARYLVVAIPDAFEAGQIVQQARTANPKIQIIARAHSDAEVEHLTDLGADIAIMGEREIARGMIDEFDARISHDS